MKTKEFKGRSMQDVRREIEKEFVDGYIVEDIQYKNSILFWKKELKVTVSGRLKKSEEPVAIAQASSLQQNFKQQFEMQTKEIQVEKPQEKSQLSSMVEDPHKKMILEMLEGKPSAQVPVERTNQQKFASVSATENAMNMIRQVSTPISEKEFNSMEVGDMKQMLEKLMNQVETNTKGFLEEENEEVLKVLYDKLLEAEVDKKIAQRLFTNLKKELTPEELLNKQVVEKALLKKMETILKTTGPFDSTVKTMAFIGPTGVGKTTTLAKIAGILKSRGKRIGLITTDVYRIGATDQLKIYADILESKMIAASSPQELKDAIDYFRNVEKVDQILIDTVGRSPMNPELIGEIKDYIDIANPDHTSLVLSSTQKYSDILKILSNFDQIDIDSVVFTKLDETMSHGVIMNVAARGKYKISYVTDGQNVPQDIYSASSEGLAKKILNGVSDFGSSLIIA